MKMWLVGCTIQPCLVVEGTGYFTFERTSYPR